LYIQKTEYTKEGCFMKQTTDLYSTPN